MHAAKKLSCKIIWLIKKYPGCRLKGK